MSGDLRTDFKQRLVTLGDVLSVRSDDRLDQFIDSFTPYLAHFAEVGVELISPKVCALTFGTTREFGETVQQQMSSNNFVAESIPKVSALQEKVDEWMVCRVDVMGDTDGAIGVYFRKKTTISETIRLLGEMGVNASNTTILNRISGILQTGTSHIFACQIRPNGQSVYKVYIQPGINQPEVLHDHLKSLFEEMAIEDEHLEFFLENHMVLATELCSNIYISLAFGENGLEHTLKLDYFHVPLAPFEELMDASGYAGELKARPTDIGNALGMTHAEHIGVLFGRSTGPQITVYFPFQRSRS